MNALAFSVKIILMIIMVVFDVQSAKSYYFTLANQVINNAKNLNIKGHCVYIYTERVLVKHLNVLQHVTMLVRLQGFFYVIFMKLHIFSVIFVIFGL